MARQAAPTYRRQWIARRHARLAKAMARFEERMLRAANLKNMDQLEAWLSSVETEGALKEMQRKVRRIQREAEEYARRWTKANMPKAYKVGEDVSITNMRRHGLKLDRLGKTRLNASAINYAIEQMDADMAMAIGSISQKLNRAFRQMHAVVASRRRLEQIASQEVARKFAAGESRQEASRAMFRRMRREFENAKGELKLVRVLGPSGKPRSYTLRYYTEMVGRTRIREAVTQGVKNSMIEHGHDFVQVTGYGCECEVCAEHEDKIFSVSGSGTLDNPNFEGPLTADAEPPYHPNCTHTLVPYIPEPGEIVNDPFSGEIAA